MRPIAPLAEGVPGAGESGSFRDDFLYREALLLEHRDHRWKLVERIPGAQDVEFLLDEELGFVGDRILRIADINYAAGEGHFFNGEAEGIGESDGFHYYVRAQAVGECRQFVMQVLALRVDGVRRAGLLGDGQFLVIHIGRDDLCAREGGGGDGSQADGAAA